MVIVPIVKQYLGGVTEVFYQSAHGLIIRSIHGDDRGHTDVFDHLSDKFRIFLYDRQRPGVGKADRPLYGPGFRSPRAFNDENFM